MPREPPVRGWPAPRAPAPETPRGPPARGWPLPRVPAPETPRGPPARGWPLPGAPALPPARMRAQARLRVPAVVRAPRPAQRRAPAVARAWLRAQARQRVPGVVRAPQPAPPLAGPPPPPRSPVDLPRLIDHRGAGRRVGAARRRDRAIDAEDARPPPGRRWLPATSTVSVRNLGSQGIPAGSTHTWPAGPPPPPP